LCVFLAACGGEAVAPDAAAAPIDAARASVDDAAVVVADDAFAPGLDAGAVVDAPSAGGGSITGHVTRSAMPAAGGRGHLYVAVFTTDPVLDRMGARNVANARVEDVDMSGSGVSVPYTVSGIPPRAEPYYVTAFLDDNHTVDATDPANAGPDRGDLVALDGFSSVQVSVPDARPVSLDLDLNFNLPF
jgi:hypothetical protein